MQWKDGRLIKAVIKSTIGGNLRLRVPNEIKALNGVVLKYATGENKNFFYKTDATPPPVISTKATVTQPELKETFVYEITTKSGQVVTLVSN